MKISVEKSTASKVSTSHVLNNKGIYAPVGEYEDTGYVINSGGDAYWIDIVNGHIEPFDSVSWEDSYFSITNEITLTFRS